MFQLLAGRDSCEITAERMKKYARMLGIKESHLLDYMRAFSLKGQNKVGIETF